MTILEVKNISKSFREKEVLKDLSFAVNKGEIYGLIGANGSGKTTTMKMILGLLTLNSGEIYVNGERVTFGDNKTNQYIGYLEDVPAFYEFMTAREYLKFIGKISETNDDKRIEALLTRVGLENVTTKIKGYSRGMRQRLGVAAALIHRPKLLLCDEPTSALDPTGRRDILNILNDIKDETTIVFSTHVLTDVERICDRVGVIYDGKIVTEWNLHDDKDIVHGVFLSVKKEESKLLSEKLSIEPFRDGYIVKDVSLKELYDTLYTLEIYPTHIEIVRQTLEERFVEVTGQ